MDLVIVVKKHFYTTNNRLKIAFCEELLYNFKWVCLFKSNVLFCFGAIVVCVFKIRQPRTNPQPSPAFDNFRLTGR